jgi:hypothetical protein
LLDPLLFDCQAGGFLTSMVGLWAVHQWVDWLCW